MKVYKHINIHISLCLRTILEKKPLTNNYKGFFLAARKIYYTVDNFSDDGKYSNYNLNLR